jgi:hypothetical protein
LWLLGVLVVEEAVARWATLRTGVMGEYAGRTGDEEPDLDDDCCCACCCEGDEVVSPLRVRPGIVCVLIELEG